MASPAPACTKALKDATATWPQRSRASDGIMGDASHQTRKSDHNEGNAFDLTHDPNNGVDCAVLSRSVLNDNRVKYVIYNRQINTKDGNGWRSYSGSNPHTQHMHVSIYANLRSNISAWPWSVGAGLSGATTSTSISAAPSANGKNYPGSPVRKGHIGNVVGIIQSQLNTKGAQLIVDNDFGNKTYQAVAAFQARSKLVADGIVGKNTWASLFSGSTVSSAKVPAYPGTLTQGRKGNNVIQLQRQLNTKGALPKISDDGVFGAKTRTAVIAFQRKTGLSVDGIVGIQTWTKLWS